MTRRRHGQELGQAFEHAEEDHVEERHAADLSRNLVPSRAPRPPRSPPANWAVERGALSTLRSDGEKARRVRPVRRSVMWPCSVVRERDFRLVARHLVDLSEEGLFALSDLPVLTGEPLIVSFRAPLGRAWVDAEASRSLLLRRARAPHGRPRARARHRLRARRRRSACSPHRAARMVPRGDADPGEVDPRRRLDDGRRLTNRTGRVILRALRSCEDVSDALRLPLTPPR